MTGRWKSPTSLTMTREADGGLVYVLRLSARDLAAVPLSRADREWLGVPRCGRPISEAIDWLGTMVAHIETLRDHEEER